MNRIIDGWRDDWRRTTTATKVALVAVAVLGLPWVTYVVLFALAYRFSR